MYNLAVTVFDCRTDVAKSRSFRARISPSENQAAENELRKELK